jgi:hypothetical protein
MILLDMANSLGGLETTLNDLLVKKAPFQLPKNVKDVLVSFAPWLALIGGVLGILGALAVFGLGSVFGPLALYGGAAFAGSYYTTFLVSSVVLGISGIIDLMAFPGLQKRSIKGWRLLFYGELVWAVSALVRFEFVNLILGAVISLYLLFQVREYYK